MVYERPQFPDNAIDIDVITAQPKEGGRHILISIDMSSHSWEAVEFTIQNIATSLDMLTMFHVLDPQQHKNDAANARTEAMVAIHEQMKEKVSRSGKEIMFRVHATFDDNAKKAVINKLQQPTASKYRMVVVGSRGQSGLKGLVNGSVSTYVMNNSPIPVVVVRHP
ncbi:hypothetical protein BC833DRAFT_602262 [Globomyces pollinis-pini]|nr:hypothetical protein BC833DRAFT_602262 [Globomyces pollinis-pini]